MAASLRAGSATGPGPPAGPGHGRATGRRPGAAGTAGAAGADLGHNVVHSFEQCAPALLTAVFLATSAVTPGWAHPGGGRLPRGPVAPAIGVLGFPAARTGISGAEHSSEDVSGYLVRAAPGIGDPTCVAGFVGTAVLSAVPRRVPSTAPTR